MVEEWVENDNLKGKPENFVFCGAFPVVQAEIKCPLVMQPHFVLVPGLRMETVIKDYRGICIVSVGMSFPCICEHRFLRWKSFR